MSEQSKSQAIEQGRMAIFTAAAAPTLEETGMMDAMTFTDAGADDVPASAAEMERMQSGGRLTVPFHQKGPGGLSLVEIDFAPGFLDA